MRSNSNINLGACAMREMFLVFCVIALSFPLASGWSCQNSCGGVSVMYPFGTGKDCGSQIFERYINCTKGRLQFFTPTGQYYVQSIDYNNNILVIQDPRMSTCSNMQSTSSFGLPVGAPFSIVSDTFVLIGCSSSSSVYNSLSNLCDPAGTQICKSLYSCPAIAELGLPVNGPTSTCCVYSNSQLNSPPYEINLPLLQCSSYSSIYSFGPQYSYGNGPSNNYVDPSTWSYGIALKYYYDQTAYFANCKVCQETNGVCAFNIYGFVCVCSAGVNTTTRCFGASVSHGSRSFSLQQTLWGGGLSMLGALVPLI